MSNTKRIFLGKNLQLPPADSLTLVQKESWAWFLKDGLKEIFQSISPVDDYTGSNWRVELGDISLGDPIVSPLKAKLKGVSYCAPLTISVKLINKMTKAEKTEEVFVTNIPTITDEGTFIIGGIERGVINQLVRSPGVYFTSEDEPATGKKLFHAEIRPLRGSWLEFFIGRKNTVYARIDRRRKFPATVLLRALGIETDKSLRREFSDFIDPTLEIDSTQNSQEALLEFYRKLRPGEPLVLENAANLFKSSFFDLHSYEIGRVGRYKANRRLGLNFADDDPKNWVLTPQDIIKTVKYLIDLQKGDETKIDDIDHLANRRLRRVGEIITQSVLRRSVAKFERAIKERMSLISTEEKIKPSQMVNFQPVVAGINSFFKTSQLSAILDQTNPLAELDILRKVTVIGPGGLTRERATFSIRDIHSSQYGRICPIKSPEGMNIGLVTYLAIYSRVNDYGFLETPFKKTKLVGKKGKQRVKITDEIVYLSADDEMDYYITYAGAAVDNNGFLIADRVPVRYGGEFIETATEKVQLIDYSPQQVMGMSAATIPFVDHDEVNRALMGSNMQCQAVPLLNPDSPIVGTGMERLVVKAMNRIVTAQASGKVTYIDSSKIVIKPDSKKDAVSGGVELKDGEHVYNLFKYQRTSPNGTCYNQKPVVFLGQKIEKGDLLADGPATQGGELALGRNLVVAYACIEGLGYEDSILVSDKLVKEDLLTSVQISEYEAQVVDTKLGPEELTRDIPGVSEADLGRLTEDGIIMIGSKVGPSDILVGKVEPKGEKELTAEERLLRAIFGEKAKDVKDTSLKVPHGEGGTVIGVQILDRSKGDELPSGVNRIVKVLVAQLRKVREGDKLAGRHGNKGVIGRIMPSYDMPRLADGTPVDVVISPLSVIARMNLGQILESHLGMAGDKLAEKYAVPSFDNVSEDVTINLLKKAGLPVSGKFVLYDGKSGEPYDQQVAVGVGYITKLHHMAEDKVHARSTGPYSLVTQQPLGGKTRMGGQRLGEMEVWALEAHRASHVLQEMLTIKSDDIEGRAKAFQAIIKGQEIPEPTLPESFKVLVKELAGLGLKVYPTGVVMKEEERPEENRGDNTDER